MRPAVLPWLAVAVLALLVTGCGTAPRGPTLPPSASAEAACRLPAQSGANRPYYEVFGHRYRVLGSNRGYQERGIASWYGPGFHGKPTSSGVRYDQHAMTAAHKTLRLPQLVEVTNLQNGRRAVVCVNDRGPFHGNRIIDLSRAAADVLGVSGPGTALVEVRVVEQVSAPSAPVAPAMSPLRWEASFGAGEAGSGAVFMQVGAFADRSNAERLEARLMAAGLKAQIEATRVKGQALNRVLVGPLGSVEAADAMADRLHALQLWDHSLVVR